MGNLNAEQIKRALECCVKVGGYRDAEICNDCPLSEKRCAILLPENALSLIKQLTEEIDDLKEDKELYSVFCEDYKKQIEDLEAISKQYQKQFEDCYEEKAKLTEENERLREQNERYAELEEGCYVTGYKNIKADTVRKMQERLKAQKFTHKNFGELVYVDDIDQIAKEMVEGAGNG